MESLWPKMDCEPPLLETYKRLVERVQSSTIGEGNRDEVVHADTVVESYELPLFDLGRLSLRNQDRADCMREIAEAASTWGFFRIVNHGVSLDLLKSLREEEMKLFHSPFLNKSEMNHFVSTPNSYRWGNPMATSPRQFSWSEAFHISLADIPTLSHSTTLRSNIKGFTASAALIAETLAEILGNNLGIESTYFKRNCLPITSYVRLNRYPPCPVSSKVYGLIPHSDTSFLTILHEDQAVGGLQFMKDGKWIGVKPNPGALTVNIGDLFQALSNGVYKSVKHAVAATARERLSVAFLYCPSDESIVESNSQTPLYNKFSFIDYKKQTIEDLIRTGDKVGLTRFFCHQKNSDL